MIKFIVIALLLCCQSFNSYAADVPSNFRSKKAIIQVESRLKSQLLKQGLEYGSPIFIRIFKRTSQLEVWLEAENGLFKLFKTYPICHYSGSLGPKLKEGDKQSPEGFYFVRAGALNPWSKFHLSFNLGYPNAYERFHKRTGSALMVHGGCVSIGCYAMTDNYMNEIYALAVAALRAGQPFFRVHVFPFKLEEEHLKPYKNSPWYGFWLNLKQGYEYFKIHQRPPNVEVLDGRYVFD